MLDKVEVGKIYRNIKNNKLYKVVFIGNYTEKPMGMELMVGYVALYPTDIKNFVRPYSLFLEKFKKARVRGL